MNSANDIREAATRYLIPYLVLHAPLVWLTGLLTGNDNLLAAVVALVIALVPLAAWRFSGAANVLTRYLTAAAFMLIIAILVYAFRGHPWQVDIHMYFFAGLAMLIAFADWRVFVVATTVIAIHHLLLNFTFPYWVYPDGGNFWRVVLHAVIVILETVVLALATVSLVAALDRSTSAVAEAEEAAAEAEKARADHILLEEEAEAEKQRATAALIETFQSEVGEIVERAATAVGPLRQMSSSMKGSVENVTSNVNQATDATTEISSGISTVAASTEELSSSIDQIARQIETANSNSSAAQNASETSVGNMNALAAKIAEIDEMSALIANIATQTNMLALNATIESARAGEAGKGFAVVAGEVKNLANQTESATEQIGGLVKEISGLTEEAVTGIEGIAAKIDDILATSTAMSAAVEEQSAATREIAGNASQTATQTSTVTQRFYDVRMSVEGNANLADELESSANALEEEIQTLRNAVASFVNRAQSS